MVIASTAISIELMPLSESQINDLTYSRCADPFAVLVCILPTWMIRILYPGARCAGGVVSRFADGRELHGVHSRDGSLAS